MSEPLASVGVSCGRYYLSVAGITLAMEGDRCRTAEIPEGLEDPIPEHELNIATIGGLSIREIAPDVVRFFRGSHWNKAMLDWAAKAINEREGNNAEGRQTSDGVG